MPENSHDLLSRLVGHNLPEGDSPWDTLAASAPAHEPADDEALASADDPALEQMLQRIQRIAGTDAADPGADAPEQTEPTGPTEAAADMEEFTPVEPQTLREAGLTESEVEALILKFLLSRGDASGHVIADQLNLSFVPVNEVLHRLKAERLLVFRDSAPMNDYIYQLTDVGRERGRRYMQTCTYFGSAPVTLGDYIDSVRAQTLERQRPSANDLQRAFSDLLVRPSMLKRLGPAVNSGRGLFLFGPPGNGKTSIAERVTRCFGQYIWIPRALSIDGEIMRLYDPSHHEDAPLKRGEGLLDTSRIDRRWVRIRRPTIVVGGELTMDSLEVKLNTTTGINEAPVQMKSNCGTLVIDDFGRQRMSIDELLNRWIVPLEKRYDFLNLASGKMIQVPFDQLIIFSTNLEPRDLVDDAFLRRFPYKIEIADPTEDDFRELFRMMCPLLGFAHSEEGVDYLIETHYRAVNRPFRCCQPRDLLLQVRNHCLYHKQPLELKPDHFDFAVDNYFAVM